MNSKKIHEKYHKKTRSQYKIINEKNFTYRILLDVLNKYIRGQKKILDIGCGAGTLSFYLASKKHNVTGIDISNKAIRICRESARNMGFKNIHFMTIDFPNEIPPGKFDAILLFEVIEHLKDDIKAIEKIYKLLKPGGILLLSTPSSNAPLHKVGLTKRFDKEVGHLRRYTVNDLSKVLISNGFRIKHTKKVEGVIRNFLFVNPFAGKFIRFIKFFFSDFVTFIDGASLKLFGESNFVIVAEKK